MKHWCLKTAAVFAHGLLLPLAAYTTTMAPATISGHTGAVTATHCGETGLQGMGMAVNGVTMAGQTIGYNYADAYGYGGEFTSTVMHNGDRRSDYEMMRALARSTAYAEANVLSLGTLGIGQGIGHGAATGDYDPLFWGSLNALLINQAVRGNQCKTPATRAAAKSTILYRAVKPGELADIQKTGQMINRGSAEGKYFTSSAADASAYAKKAVSAFKDPPYTIIKTEVPAASLPRPVSVDGGIPAYVIPNEALPGLTPQVMPTMPIPGVR